MAAADRKITYTAAEVAELIRPLTQSVEALQKENAELKRKLEHMNEILVNAQRARFGQSSEKKTYVLSEDQMACSMRRRSVRTTRQRSLRKKPSP